MKTRLAYLVSQYPAISHTFILREVDILRKKGLEIHVASINSPDRKSEGLTEQEKSEAMKTFYIKKQGVLGALKAFFKVFMYNPAGLFKGFGYALYLAGLDLKRLFLHIGYFAEALLIGEWMAAQRLRHLHVHFANPASTAAIIAHRIYGINYSLTVHGPDEFSDTTLHLVKEKILGAKFICCIGYFARSQLMRLCPYEEWKKLIISPLGVDIDQFHPNLKKTSEEQVFSLLCVGRLVPAKGQHVLLDALKMVKAKFSNIKLVLIGDGPDRQVLEKHTAFLHLQNEVQFVGAVPANKILEYYSQADLFILPSFSEGIPVVLMEAMSMEIPCISTFVNGIPELIRHEIDGWLVPPSAPRELADAIIDLLRDPHLRKKLGTAGRKRIMENYEIMSNTEQLADIFTHFV